MADIRVTALPEASALADADVLHGVQNADARDKRFTLQDLKTYVGAGGTGSVASVTAGAGLANSGTATDPVLDVGSGTGLTVNADNVAVDRTTVDTWYAPAAHVGAGDAAHSAATTSTAGFLSASDKTKLDGIATGSQPGTVTSVATGTGLTGGPVTTSGTISLTNTAVTSGSYTLANITVDAQGRITAASNGSAPGTTNLSYTTAASTGTVNSNTGTNATIPAATTSLAGLLTSTDKAKLDGITAGAKPGTVTSVSGTAPIVITGTATTTPTVTVTAASTTASGVVQLSTSTNSTSTTLAGTASAVKTAYDLAAAALARTGGTMTGGVYQTVRTISNNAAWDMSTGNLWTFAGGTLANPSNATAGMTGVILCTGAITAYGGNFTTQPATATTPCVVPYYVTATDTIRLGLASPA